MKRARELAPDLARGVMLLLIAMAYAGVYVGAGFGVDASAAPWWDQATVVATTLLLDNRAFPMFAILFGYGLAWSVQGQLARGVPEPEVRRRVRRRGWFLLLFGGVHAVLIFPGEILSSYGLSCLLLGWLLFRSDRAVGRAMIIFVVVYLILVPLFAISVAMTPAEAMALPGYGSPKEWIARLISAPVTPIYIALAYPLFLLVIIGVRAGRQHLLANPAGHLSFLKKVAVAGVTLSVAGAVPAALLSIGVINLAPLVTGVLNGLQILTGVAGGAGYAAAFALVSIRLDRERGPLTRAVAAMGSRSLTFYLLHSVLVMVILHHDVFGLGQLVGPLGALLVAVGVWVIGLVIASWLERAGRPRPMDALLRRLIERPWRDKRSGSPT